MNDNFSIRHLAIERVKNELSNPQPNLLLLLEDHLIQFLMLTDIWSEFQIGSVYRDILKMLYIVMMNVILTRFCSRTHRRRTLLLPTLDVSHK